MKALACYPVVLVFFLFALVTATSSTHAATITVQNTADSGPGSFRQALIDAADGDTINFDPGVIGTITLSSPLSAMNKGLRIVGPGAAKLTLSGNSLTSILGGGLFEQPFSISGLTFANGLASGISSPTGFSGVLSVSDCVFRDNVGGSLGGAIQSVNGAATFLRCTFTNNRSTGSGGAIAKNDDYDLTIDRCVFSGNTAADFGGAIYASITGLIVINSRFIDNSGASGGAIFLSSSAVTNGSTSITRSTFGGNRATGRSPGPAGPSEPAVGGAIVARNLTLNHCTLSGNVAEGTGARGGAILRHTNLTINNCTIAGNSAPTGSGGGISTYPDSGAETTTIYSSIVAGNSAATAPDIQGNIVSQDYNLIQDTAGVAITGATAHNKYGVDPLLGSLAGYGGPTETRRLLAGSPAIDGGNPAEAVGTDQRGLPRVKDGDGNGSAIADIGAFEVQSTVAVSGRVSTANGNGVAGATVTLGGLTVQSNGSGDFLFAAVPAGGYVMRPSYGNFEFTPGSRTVYVATTSVSGQNFVGGHSIVGRVYNRSGVGLVNVKVTRSGSATPVFTNSAGYYKFATLVPGSYTITPSQAGMSFTPASRLVDVSSNNVSAQNFIEGSGYTISGRIANSRGIGLVGVTVTLSGSGSTAVSNSAGYYTFNNVPNGSYTITPSQGGMTFSPNSKNITVSGANVSGLNFIGANS